MILLFHSTTVKSWIQSFFRRQHAVLLLVLRPSYLSIREPPLHRSAHKQRRNLSRACQTTLLLRHIASSAPSPCGTKRVFFNHLFHVCPEPVLANARGGFSNSNKWRKKKRGFLITVRHVHRRPGVQQRPRRLQVAVRRRAVQRGRAVTLLLVDRERVGLQQQLQQRQVPSLRRNVQHRQPCGKNARVFTSAFRISQSRACLGKGSFSTSKRKCDFQSSENGGVPHHCRRWRS